MGFVVWFTGLSGSGKSTLAARLAAELGRRGVHVETLDGDEVRAHLSKGLGFSREDRDTNVHRIGFVAKLLARSGACAITAAISPYREARDAQRRAIPCFVEVYCACPVEVLAARDPKGLYRRALAGEIQHFTGVDDPYDVPTDPEVLCRTDVETTDESLQKIVAALEARGYLAAAQGDVRGDAVLRPHGGELVSRPWRRAAPRAAAVRLDAAGVTTLRMLASGALSPLRGFMNARDHHKVRGTARLEGGRPWGTPVTLALDPVAAEPCAPGVTVDLASPGGELVGELDVTDVHTVEGDARVFVGGEVRGDTSLASDVRAWIAREGHARVTAVPVEHPVDEALRWALRRALEDGDAVLAMVLDGEPDAVRAALPEAPAARVHAVALALPESAAPRRALDLAVIAQNLGAAALWLAADADTSLLDALAPGELSVSVMRRPRLGWSAARGAVVPLHAAADAVPLEGAP